MTEKIIQTLCLGCVFADLKENNQNLFLQESCKLNNIEKFKKTNCEIIEAVDEKNNEFFVINDRICPFFRNDQWRNTHGLSNDISELSKKVNEEVIVKIDAVVYFDDNNTTDDITNTLNSLKECKIKPKNVFIINNSNLRPSQIMSVVKDFPIKWRIETIIQENANIYEAMDIVAKKCKSMFIALFMSGNIAHKDLFYNLNKVLYDELKKVIMVLPKNENDIQMIVLKHFYSTFRGNKDKTIVKKAKEISEEQKCPHLIMSMSQLLERR